MLNFGKPIAKDEAEALSQSLAGAGTMTLAQHRWPVDHRPGWDAGAATSPVTRSMLEHTDKLKPGDLKKLDNLQLRLAANDALKVYEAKQKAGGTSNPALMNLLRVIRDGGVRGFEAAFNDPNEILPALSALGLIPVLLGVEHARDHLVEPERERSVILHSSPNAAPF